MNVNIGILIEHPGAYPGERFPIAIGDCSLQDKLKIGVAETGLGKIIATRYVVFIIFMREIITQKGSHYACS